MQVWMIFPFSSKSGIELAYCCGLYHVLRQYEFHAFMTSAEECVPQSCSLYVEFFIVSSCCFGVF